MCQSFDGASVLQTGRNQYTRLKDKIHLHTGISLNKIYMSHVMRKPVYAKCEQQKHTSAMRSLISAFVFRCLDIIILLVSISEFSSLHLAYVAAQAGMSLTWSETPKTGFLETWLI